jgi:hypothetical protein
MTRTGILLAITTAFIFYATLAPAHEGGEATQTDWSGGPGVPGPVTGWGNTFESGTNVNWFDVPGDLKLTRTPIEYVVSETIDTPSSVHAADVDGDGDTDVLGAALTDMFEGAVYWWENLDGSGTSWGEHLVDDEFAGAISVYSADLDGDDDMDAIGAALTPRDIVWWENADGAGTSWTKHPINTDYWGAYSVYAADVDGDDDMDVLGAGEVNCDVTWWENVDGTGITWEEHIVDEEFTGANSVYAADVDGDMDIDVLAAAGVANDITWWEKHIVADDFEDASDVKAADVDGDSDIDVIGAGSYEDDITWWENVDGSGTSWEAHAIDNGFEYASSVYPADVDGDADIDVLSAAGSDNDISWWENLDGVGGSWAKRTVDGDFGGAGSVYAADVDGDGKLDVLGAAELDDKVAWWDIAKFAAAGELVSSIYDTGGSPEWGFIDWTADTPENTAVKFQVRASNAWGVMGNWSNDITVHPFGLEGFVEDGLRYIQYKAILETTDPGVTSTLEDVTIDWGYTDIVVTSFEAESVRDGVEVYWECADEVSGFNLYRSTAAEGKAVNSRDKLNAELITGESPYSYLDAAVEESATYNYWLEAMDVGGAAETFGPVECTWNGALPTAYALYQSRPNPATGTATLAFDLPEDTKVTLAVYDISGRKVTTVVDELLTVGSYERTVSAPTNGRYQGLRRGCMYIGWPLAIIRRRGRWWLLNNLSKINKGE